MPNTAIFGASSNAQINATTTPLAFQGQFSFTENRAPVLFQIATTAPTLLALGGVTDVLAILLKVTAGSGTQHVYLGLDNAYPPTQRIGDIPELLGTLLIRPDSAHTPAQIYLSCDSGTILVQYQVIAK